LPAFHHRLVCEEKVITTRGDKVFDRPLPYLDVIRRVKEAFPELALATYNVSGEYAMLKAAARNGWLDEQKVVLEALTSIKRADADLILTYHAKDAARWLKD
jgi:porphobilinogen synthase